MEETTDCDNVVIIDNGQISANGTPNNLKNTYAQNSLIWYTEQSESTENMLSESKLNFEYLNSAYHIKIEKSAEATELINKFKIEDYEVIKGDMDSVFLNITGKRLGE